MKKTTTAIALMVGLSAGSASAQTVVGPNDLQGSDTMFDLMKSLTGKLGIAPANLTYVGGGSGAGTAGMLPASNRQEIAAASRFFNATECGFKTAATIGYAIAGDAIVNLASSTGPACAGLNWGSTIVAVDSNGAAGIQGPASVGLGDWRDVMRIIYSGRTEAGKTAAQDCNSDIRNTLVNNWGNLFKNGCATGSCTTGLTHAFRRDDLSGTTDTYLELLQLPRFTDKPTPTVSPFCNGFDNEDKDPIRRTCAGKGFGGVGDEVCGVGGKLGVVLPVLIPQENAYGEAATPPAATGNCGASALGGAAFGSVAWSLADSQRYGATCPNGAKVSGGTCKWPKKSGSAAGQGFGCIASSVDRPSGSPSTFDARVYNLWLRNGAGTVLAYQRNGAQVRANVSYYRAHQVAGCNKADATDQIGCFVTKDACSIGFAGVGSLVTPNTKALSIRNDNPDASGAYSSVLPPATNDPNLLTKLNDYPLGRRLWVLTVDNFADVGAQPASFVTAQHTIFDAVTAGSATVDQAVAETGFYVLPKPWETKLCP
jgi:ABC-type phosphate transport system substrate-binding protein